MNESTKAQFSPQEDLLCLCFFLCFLSWVKASMAAMKR